MSLGLRNSEIASRLCLSVKTVGSYHAKHIYDKLGVHFARAAVARARELGWV
jgi:DNA-binding NarL/FixJ family response regulator